MYERELGREEREEQHRHERPRDHEDVDRDRRRAARPRGRSRQSASSTSGVHGSRPSSHDAQQIGRVLHVADDRCRSRDRELHCSEPVEDAGLARAASSAYHGSADRREERDAERDAAQRQPRARPRTQSANDEPDRGDDEQRDRSLREHRDAEQRDGGGDARAERRVRGAVAAAHQRGRHERELEEIGREPAREREGQRRRQERERRAASDQLAPGEAPRGAVRRRAPSRSSASCCDEAAAELRRRRRARSRATRAQYASGGLSRCGTPASRGTSQSPCAHISRAIAR